MAQTRKVFQLLAISRMVTSMTDLYDKTWFHDYAIQVPHLMIEAQKGQIQECHVREEVGLE